MPWQYVINLSGVPIPCRFQYIQNVQLCKKFIMRQYDGLDAVGVAEIERQIYHKAYPNDRWNYKTESKALVGVVSDELLLYNRMIFHSVAVLWHKKAWLISAPSGTGKTTQYKNLKQLYEEEIQIICGDNPILHFQENGTIMVFPSPWNWKERFCGDEVAPLAGIIYLAQGKEDIIERLSPGDAVVPVFHEINTYARTTELVNQLFKLEEKMITSVPIWRFENTGTKDSSRILMQCMKQYEGTEEIL